MHTFTMLALVLGQMKTFGRSLQQKVLFLELFANKLINYLGALFTFDVATPMEFTMASFDLYGLELVVTPPAAH